MTTECSNNQNKETWYLQKAKVITIHVADILSTVLKKIVIYVQETNGI